jgi:outer membrane protein OmpA-like peptidoglycan-associated protein
MNPSRTRILAVALSASVFASACASGRMDARGSGALIGATGGAASGAIIGSTHGRAGEAAVVGGVVGAIAGAIIGDSIEARRQRAARDAALAEELRRQDLDARETERGVIVNLPDILFQFGRSELTPGARRKIATIREVLNGPNVAWRRVSVEGHTDSIGSEEANQRLSERRAQSVASALMGAGVARERISIEGFGERYPRASNVRGDGSDDPQGRQQNRRVEVVILNEEEPGYGRPGPMPTRGDGYDPAYDQGGYPGGGQGYPPNQGTGYPNQGPGYPNSGPGFPNGGPGYPPGSGPGYPGPGYPPPVDPYYPPPGPYPGPPPPYGY